MGRRGFGQRRTVLQLGDKKEPTYGFGYKPVQRDGKFLVVMQCEKSSAHRIHK